MGYSKRKGSNADEISTPTLYPAKKTKVVSLKESTYTDTVDDRPANPVSVIQSGLHDLLDFTSLGDEISITNRFDTIARVLMHEHQLVVLCAGTETAFEIQEIEFYLQKVGCYEDPFTHGSEEQKVSGRWYVPSYIFCQLHSKHHSRV